jgi:hypothetical protein
MLNAAVAIGGLRANEEHAPGRVVLQAAPAAWSSI